MNKQEQPQPKRVNVSRGTYVRLVISGSMLLLGGLINAPLDTPAVANGVVYVELGGFKVFAYHLPGQPNVHL